MNAETSLDDLIAGLLSEAATEAEAETASPRTPVKRNPWKFQGIKLVWSKVTCSRCGATTNISHGLVEHFQHERDDRTWESELIQTSLELPEPFLGYTELASGTVHGCLNCLGASLS